MKTQIEFDPIQKRNLNPKRKQKTRLSVDRPCARSTGPVDRIQPRAEPSQLVDRPCRPLSAPVDRAVDRANLCTLCARRSTGRSTGLLHRSTGRPTGSAVWPASMCRFAPLSSDLCANFLYSSISSLPQIKILRAQRPHY